MEKVKPATPIYDDTGLVEKLRQVDSNDSEFYGPDEPRTCWHRNPEGPEAADRITALTADVVTLARQSADKSAELAALSADNAGLREALRAVWRALPESNGRTPHEANIADIIDQALKDIRSE